MISVFKTSVKNRKNIQKLKADLDAHFSSKCWNFDLEDCDKILRIISDVEIKNEVTELLAFHGFNCAELEA